MENNIFDFKHDLILSLNGISFTMKPVKGGIFWRGTQNTDPYGINYDKDAQKDDLTIHECGVPDFYIGETPCTQALWGTLNPYWYVDSKKRDYPIGNVSWSEVRSFIRRLNDRLSNQLLEFHFRLPKEIEWEYAARGGQHSHGYQYAGGNEIDEVAWRENRDWTHPIKEKKPNELGLYDMSGNVWEWCEDVFWIEKNGEKIQPKQAKPGVLFRVCRGGSFNSAPVNCRVSSRKGFHPGHGTPGIGFRLLLAK
ncbi:MAG: SUMF1/EgtB/PvdO family nonheme iron enzyme [Bacteroidales bacterium]|nr:SUMF1/EgtB/PvdO family nonheme iron enzyme [Bacteroidales bacterium]